MAASASSAAGRKLNPEAVIVIQSLEEWAAQIELSKQSKKLVVIDFTASWCGPCRMMAPMFAELATKFTDVIFLKVDVDELKPIAEQFNIQAMPTFLFMKDGDVKDKIVGARKDDLPKKIEQHK